MDPLGRYRPHKGTRLQWQIVHQDGLAAHQILEHIAQTVNAPHAFGALLAKDAKRAPSRGRER